MYILSIVSFVISMVLYVFMKKVERKINESEENRICLKKDENEEEKDYFDTYFKLLMTSTLFFVSAIIIPSFIITSENIILIWMLRIIFTVLCLIIGLIVEKRHHEKCILALAKTSMIIMLLTICHDCEKSVFDAYFNEKYNSNIEKSYVVETNEIKLNPIHIQQEIFVYPNYFNE